MIVHVLLCNYIRHENFLSNRMVLRLIYLVTSSTRFLYGNLSQRKQRKKVGMAACSLRLLHAQREHLRPLERESIACGNAKSLFGEEVSTYWRAQFDHALQPSAASLSEVQRRQMKCENRTVSNASRVHGIHATSIQFSSRHRVLEL